MIDKRGVTSEASHEYCRLWIVASRALYIVLLRSFSYFFFFLNSNKTITRLATEMAINSVFQWIIMGFHGTTMIPRIRRFQICSPHLRTTPRRREPDLEAFTDVKLSQWHHPSSILLFSLIFPHYVYGLTPWFLYKPRLSAAKAHYTVGAYHKKWSVMVDC